MAKVTVESIEYDVEIKKKQEEMGEDYAFTFDDEYYYERIKKLGLDKPNIMQSFKKPSEYARLESEITPRKFADWPCSILEDFPIPNTDSYTYSLLMGHYKYPQKVLDKLKEYPAIYEKYKETFPEVYDLLKEEGYDI